MATHNIYWYKCQKQSCSYVEQKGGMKRIQMKCPRCGWHMVLIKTEKIK